jgi:hypothetical protein
MMLKPVKHRQWWKVGNYPTNYAVAAKSADYANLAATAPGEVTR